MEYLKDGKMENETFSKANVFLGNFSTFIIFKQKWNEKGEKRGIFKQEVYCTVTVYETLMEKQWTDATLWISYRLMIVTTVITRSFSFMLASKDDIFLQFYWWKHFVYWFLWDKLRVAKIARAMEYVNLEQGRYLWSDENT